MFYLTIEVDAIQEKKSPNSQIQEWIHATHSHIHTNVHAVFLYLLNMLPFVVVYWEKCKFILPMN